MYSAGSHDHTRPRFGEMSHLLPVFFVLSLVAVLYVVYVCLHCIPLLQLDLPAANQNPDDFARGLRQLVIFHVDTFLLMYCFICCILVHPGTIPSTPEWQLNPDDPVSKNLSGDSRSLTLETKHTGERRHCKWCSRYKPDRCHHCRVCNTCILRMDHHCPWVHNCIGFRNHKYFFLLLLYCVIDLNLIVFTMFHSTEQSTRDNVPFALMLLLIFGETLASFLAVLVTSFFFFHIWLMMKAMTTIEFCEKSLKKVGYDASAYSRCSYGNICEVLGPRPALWFLPCSLPEGSGVSWTDEKMPLAATGSSSSKGIKHRSSGVGVDDFSSSSAAD